MIIYAILVGSWVFCLIGFCRMLCKINELQAENFALRYREERRKGDEESSAFLCLACVHISKHGGAYPCSRCIHLCADHFEEASE